MSGPSERKVKMMDLKQCPFCGSEKVVIRSSADRIRMFVYCTGCQAQGSLALFRTEYECYRLAARKWNRRDGVAQPPESSIEPIKLRGTITEVQGRVFVMVENVNSIPPDTQGPIPAILEIENAVEEGCDDCPLPNGDLQACNGCKHEGGMEKNES